MFSVCVMFRKASAGPGCTSHILTVKSLAKWVRAEFEIFKLFLKTILDEKVAQAKGKAKGTTWLTEYRVKAQPLAPHVHERTQRCATVYHIGMGYYCGD